MIVLLSKVRKKRLNISAVTFCENYVCTLDLLLDEFQFSFIYVACSEHKLKAKYNTQASKLHSLQTYMQFLSVGHFVK